MDMLTSNGNQYLRPEYLTPLPTTLDAKKSPLALLAQTCSQIGADPPSTKSLLNSLTASSRSSGGGGDHSENERSASSSSSSGTSTSNPGSLSLNHSKKKSSSSSGHKSTSGGRTPGEKSEKSHSKVNHSLNSNSSNTPEESTRANNSNSGGMSNEKNVTTSEQPDDKGTSGAKTPGSTNTTTTPSNKTTSRTGTPNITNATTTTASTGNTSPGSTSTNLGNKSPLSASSSSNTTTRANTTASPPDTFMSKSHESSSSIPRPSPPSSKDKLNLTGPDLSPLGSLATSTSSISNKSHSQLPSSLVPFPGLYPGLPPPSPCHPGGSAIPPYLHSYARLKAAAAAGNLGASADHLSQLSSPLTSSGGSGCRDPFCTGCQLGAAGHLSSLAAAGGKCPAGCISCDHHKSPLSSLQPGSFTGFPPLFPGFPHLPPSLASLYSSVHQSNSAAAGSSIGPSPTQPYVCNWIAGDTYCGKRFSSSEELLQHLRSHTNLSSGNSEPGTLSSVMDRYGPPTHHLLSSAAHISRTYPTPPLSPLSSARFHPYSKPGSGALSSLGLPGTFPPGFGPPPGFSALAAAAAAAAAAANNPLNPYYPYSLYGQRLGASGLGHP